MLLQPSTEISQPSGSEPTARPSSTSCSASVGSARRISTIDDDPRPAPPRVARGAQLAAGEHLHRRGAAEVEVAAPPADDLPAGGLELVRRGGIRAALAVHDR